MACKINVFLIWYTTANMKTKFVRQYLIEIKGNSTLIKGAKQTLLENSFEQILQDHIGSLQKILPFPAEKLSIRIKHLEYLTDLDK